MHLGAMTVRIVAFAPADSTARGVEIAAVGLLTVFLTVLPRLLERLAAIWPERADHHALSPDAGQADEEDDVLAAIGFVLDAHTRRQP